MRAVLVVALAALVLAGCSSEEEPYYDGAESSVVAGVPEALASQDAEVVAAGEPTDATAAEVTAALSDAGLDGAAEVTDGLALDPDATAGLLAVVGDPDAYVLLVFDDVASAAVLAEAAPAVFSDAARDRRRLVWFAGNVVGYSDPDVRGQQASLRAALRSLAGTPEAAPSTSPTTDAP